MLSKFIKESKKCARRNKITPFGAFRSRGDIDQIDSFGQYYDGQAFTHILSIQFRKKRKIQQYCTQLSISLRNLSATFLLIQYRVYVANEFNEKIAEVCKDKYSGYTTVYRQFNTPWYAVRRFGRSFHTGDNVRQEKIYEMVSQLKWQIMKEIRKTFPYDFGKIEYSLLYSKHIQQIFVQVRSVIEFLDISSIKTDLSHQEVLKVYLKGLQKRKCRLTIY